MTTTKIPTKKRAALRRKWTEYERVTVLYYSGKRGDMAARVDADGWLVFDPGPSGANFHGGPEKGDTGKRLAREALAARIAT